MAQRLALSLTFIAAIAFAAFFFHLYDLNQDDVTLRIGLPPITEVREYPTSLVLALYMAFGAGVATVFLVSLFRDARHLVLTLGERRIERQRKKAQELTEDGETLLERGDRRKAREALIAALDKNPNTPEAYLALARSYSEVGDHESAIRYLTQARGDNIRVRRALQFALVEAYETTGRLPEAIRTCQALLEQDAENLRVLRKMVSLSRAAQKWREATQVQREIVKALPHEGRGTPDEELLRGLRYQHGLSQLADGEPEAAAKTFKEILRRDEHFVPAHVSLGDTYRTLEAPEEAAKAWERGYRTHPAVVFLMRLEDLYLEAEDPNAAIRAYRRVVDEDPSNLLPGLYLGKLYLRLEMLDEALEQLKQIEGRGADYYDLHLLMAEVFRRRGLHDLAVQEFQKALGFRRNLLIPFVCRACGHEQAAWSGVCPACGHYNTLYVRYETPPPSSAGAGGGTL